MRDFSNIKKLIIKIGSSSLVSNNSIRMDIIDDIMKSFKKLEDKGISVSLVTSGAIAVGMIELGIDKKPSEMALKQACAAVGQAKLMEAYNVCAKIHGLKTGQILVNHDDFQVRKRMLNLTESLDAMLKNKIIPIINENDALAVEEIKVGDNDTLAALITPMISADLLILFSDIDGLYNKNPREYDDAYKLDLVEEINEDIFNMAGSAGSKYGTGGMATKINAALISTLAGSDMIICNSNQIENLTKIVDGEDIGTLFKKSKTAISSREHWLIFKTSPTGAIIIDEGLVSVLNTKKKSILAKGIVNVTGEFLAGSVIDVKDVNDNLIAKGLVNFSSSELRDIKGLSSADIKKLFGEDKKYTVIHADNLVIMEDSYGTTAN